MEKIYARVGDNFRMIVIVQVDFARREEEERNVTSTGKFLSFNFLSFIAQDLLHWRTRKGVFARNWREKYFACIRSRRLDSATTTTTTRQTTEDDDFIYLVSIFIVAGCCDENDDTEEENVREGKPNDDRNSFVVVLDILSSVLFFV